MDFSLKPGGPPNEMGSGVKFAPYDARPDASKTDWINFILYTLVAISILLSAFFAGWYFVLKNGIASKKEELAEFENKLAELPINAIRELSSKLNLANSITRNYPYSSALFSVLEDSVENGIVYDTFDLRADSGGYLLNLSGIAPNYRTVAQQYDILTSSKYSKFLGKITVESLRPNSRGDIEFTFKIAANIRDENPEKVRVELTKESEIPVEVISDSPTQSQGSGNAATSTTTP